MRSVIRDGLSAQADAAMPVVLERRPAESGLLLAPERLALKRPPKLSGRAASKSRFCDLERAPSEHKDLGRT